jgi:xylan 1,4-beta-xylosidase
VVNDAHSWAADASLPFLITEYNVAYFGHDTSYAAAFLTRNIPVLTGLDVLSYWTFTGIFEEGWLAGPPFQDTWGAMTEEGIRKPVWRAFQMLHHAGDQTLDISVAPPRGAQTAMTAFATTLAGASGLRGLQIFTANFWPSAAASANARPPVATALRVQLVPPPGEVLDSIMPMACFLWRIDDNSTAPAGAWRAMGSPGEPTPQQFEVLARASLMVSEELAVSPGGTLSFALPPFGVAVVRFDGANRPSYDTK